MILLNAVVLRMMNRCLIRRKFYIALLRLPPEAGARHRLKVLSFAVQPCRSICHTTPNGSHAGSTR